MFLEFNLILNENFLRVENMESCIEIWKEPIKNVSSYSFLI